MTDSYGTDHDGGALIFHDVITLALLGMMALVVILLLHLNPPGKNVEAAVDPPGNVIIEVSWASEADTDVAPWVQAPGDKPVGYSLQPRYQARRVYGQRALIPQPRRRAAATAALGCWSACSGLWSVRCC